MDCLNLIGPIIAPVWHMQSALLAGLRIEPSLLLPLHHEASRLSLSQWLQGDSAMGCNTGSSSQCSDFKRNATASTSKTAEPCWGKSESSGSSLASTNRSNTLAWLGGGNACYAALCSAQLESLGRDLPSRHHNDSCVCL